MTIEDFAVPHAAHFRAEEKGIVQESAQCSKGKEESESKYSFTAWAVALVSSSFSTRRAVKSSPSKS